MKKLLATIFILMFMACWIPYPVYAANSHSVVLQQSSSQYAYDDTITNLKTTGDVTVEYWVKLDTLILSPFK